jgi:hypothetical protein
MGRERRREGEKERRREEERERGREGERERGRESLQTFQLIFNVSFCLY